MIILVEICQRTVESRKDQLQKQIIEALESNDNELYVLLKSQWAHRFGVESLEELDDLDLYKENQKTNKKIESIEQEKDDIFEKQPDDLTEERKDLSLNQDKILEKDKKELDSLRSSNSQSSFEIKSVSTSEEVKKNSQAENKVFENNNIPHVEPLIPIPPKPKYSYLKRWLIGRY